MTMWPHRLSLHSLLLPVCCAWLLSACSTARPWINPPATAAAPAVEPVAVQTTRSPSIVAAVTLSGGGARAAAFGLGVLAELKATRFDWEGRSTNLLDEVGLISGVSGGSVLATYYAAFGDEVFTRFEKDFLLVDFQAGLIRDMLSPSTAWRLGSPWWGRSQVLAERLEVLFRGRRFADLRGRRPHLLVTATDLTTGAPFEFTPEQFGLICSDLDAVPLSFAVAASSAVPLLLSPLTVRNYAGNCPEPVRPAEVDAGNVSAWLLDLIAESYRDSEQRPFIHLVDGGVVDNLGVRGLLERTLAGGSFDASFRSLAPGSVHHIVLVSVNSEKDTAERIDGSDRVPSNLQVLDALVFGAGSRMTKETTVMVDDVARRMAEALRAERGRPSSPFAADAEVHVINVGLRDLQDEDLRRQLLRVPTAFTVLPLQVRQLQQAGRQVLRESPAFQRLRHQLAAEPQPAD
jgi:NTE family protein